MANTLYENNTGTDDDILRISTTTFVSQNFTPQTTHYLTGVELKLDINGTGPADGNTLTVQIKAVDGANKPTGAVLASGTLAIANVSTTAGYYSFLLYTGNANSPFLQVAEDTMYAIVLSSNSTYNADNCIVWRGDAGGGGYAYGGAFLTANSGSTWASQSPMLMMFKEYGSTDLNGILLERFDYDHDDSGGFGGADWRGITFTPTIRHQLTSVSFLIWRDNPIGSFTVSLYSTSSGIPTGTALVTKAVDTTGIYIGSPGTWFQVTFDTNPVLQVGTMYALTFDARDDTNLVYREKIGGGYAGGTKLVSANSGGTWTTDAEDLMFREYGNITSYYTLDTSVTTYALTGVNITTLIAKWYAITCQVTSYVLTNVNAILTFVPRWTYKSKNSASYTNKTKHTSSFTNKSKNDTSWTNKDKS